jgi:serine/threonine protein kinase
MSSFPEEPFNLSPSEGGGYYPATIHQKLNGDKYEIIRKLGYGPRSSTWLVCHTRDLRYYAVKIFTVAASERAKSVELPIAKAVHELSSVSMAAFHGSFWEESGAGSHLCFVGNISSTSVQGLQRDAENHRLPVHVVQRIVCTAASALSSLHVRKIMHGGMPLIASLFHLDIIADPLLAVKADNIFFTARTEPEFLKPVLDSTPPITVKKYSTILSQPLMHGFKWNEKAKQVVDWPIHLDNFGHGKNFSPSPLSSSYCVSIAQRWNYEPEKTGDYSSAPETLLHQATCSLQTDIWMLGCLVRSYAINLFTYHSHKHHTR